MRCWGRSLVTGSGRSLWDCSLGWLAMEDDLALEVVVKDSVSSFTGHPVDYLGAKLGWESFDDVVGLRGGRRDSL